MGLRRREIRKKRFLESSSAKTLFTIFGAISIVLILFVCAFFKELRYQVLAILPAEVAQFVSPNQPNLKMQTKNFTWFGKWNEEARVEAQQQSLGTTLQAFEVNLVAEKSTEARLSAINTMLQRAHSEVKISKGGLLGSTFVKETAWDTGLAIHSFNHVLPILGSEVLELTIGTKGPSRHEAPWLRNLRKALQAGEAAVTSFTFRSLGASLDQQETPATGTLYFSGGAKRAFTVPTNGSRLLVHLQAEEKLPVRIEWSTEAPGFLVLENIGIQDNKMASVPLLQENSAKSSTFSKTAFHPKTLRIFVVNAGQNQTPLSTPKEMFPSTFNAMKKSYAANFAQFNAVIPETTELQKATLSLIKGVPAAEKNTQPDRIELSNSLLYSTFAAHKSASFAQIATEPRAEFWSVSNPESWQPGAPQQSFALQRSEEVENALFTAVQLAESSEAALQLFVVDVASSNFQPSLHSFLARNIFQMPSYLFRALEHNFGVKWSELDLVTEKISQIDRAIARSVTAADAKRIDNSLFVMRDNLSEIAESTLYQPKSFAWIGSSLWKNEESSNPRLLPLSRFQVALSALLRGSASALTQWKELGREQESHAIIESGKGEWHLFPYGQVYFGCEGETCEGPTSQTIWNVPQAKLREAEAEIQRFKLRQGTKGINFYFTPRDGVLDLSLNTKWSLQPKFCANRGGSAIAKVVSEINRDAQNNFWIRVTQQPGTSPAWIYCLFDITSHSDKNIEIHALQGKSALASHSIALGEFGFKVTTGEDDVPGLARAKAFFELLNAWSPPAFEFLPTLPIHIWEEPVSDLSFSEEQKIAIQTTDTIVQSTELPKSPE